MSNKEWNPQNGVAAFTAALTRSGYDQSFRNRLVASPESARAAVAEEGQIDIPADIVMMFHPDELNEKYHVFYLPEFDASKPNAKHEYAEFFQGCYNAW